MARIYFNKKLSAKRDSSNDKKQILSTYQLKSAYESDRGRIINSAAIRRLQQKTQVFPLERNAAVRSRLTHSMEVQQVGRFILQSIYSKLIFMGKPKDEAASSETISKFLEAYNLTKYVSRHFPIENTNLVKLFGLEDIERHLETVTEMACLLHDVGNPPFGHFGEKAIINWFTQNLDSILTANFGNTSTFPSELKEDICNFEGNAQAIRLVHSVQALNLTYSQVAAILKYTRCGTEPKPTDHKEANFYSRKKVGFYYSEKRFVEDVWKELDIATGNRYPLTYIMEAADDISYCIADLEDAVDKNILTLDSLRNELIEQYDKTIREFNLIDDKNTMKSLLDKASKQYEGYYTSNVSEFFVKFRVGINHLLVEHAVERFIKNIEAVFNGTLDKPLLEDRSLEHAISETLKVVARNKVFCAPEVEQAELQGYKIIEGLLNCYRPLLLLKREQLKDVITQSSKSLILEIRLFKKLPSKQVVAYKKATETLDGKEVDDNTELYYRCRLIQDYISGMTDQYAFDEIRMFSIIE
jgi:dGTPase